MLKMAFKRKMKGRRKRGRRRYQMVGSIKMVGNNQKSSEDRKVWERVQQEMA